MQEVVKKEIVKLLDTGIIYPIADSPWVSPIHCVPKKGESVKVFMDDFSVFGNSFDKCLNNLDKMLLDKMIQRCKDAHLVLNWEKCHFMVKEGIVLGHKVSSAGLEVDKAKIDVISKLLPLTNIKGVRSFLGHAGFYRRFIKYFSKIARPITKLFEKDNPFEFNDEYQKSFELLKEKLICAPVIFKGIKAYVSAREDCIRSSIKFRPSVRFTRRHPEVDPHRFEDSYKDGDEDFRYSDTLRLSQSDKVLKLKNFKKDVLFQVVKLNNQE
ncbi:hypothetical protein Tco_0806049 [Tanacetum coccineum]